MGKLENNQELKFTVENGVKELKILSGEAEPPYYDKSIEVKEASIKSVHEFLAKKGIDNADIVNSKIEFSYTDLFLNLYYSIRRRNPDTIKGILKIHHDLLKFQINKDKTYTTFQLADFIRMNRHYFENKEIAMKLVGELKHFEAKVNKEVELKADTRANNKILINQVVESNIPASFVLVLPIFIGQEKERLTVEIDITSDLTCSLVSPDLKQMIDEQTKVIIDEELGKIRALHPDLKIFEL